MKPLTSSHDSLRLLCRPRHRFIHGLARRKKVDKWHGTLLQPVHVVSSASSCALPPDQFPFDTPSSVSVVQMHSSLSHFLVVDGHHV